MATDDIQGQVTDSSGNAVGGAIVALWSQDNPNNVVTTQADSSGNYIFDSHPDGNKTTQNWHLAAYDPNDGSRQFPSLHTISSQLYPPIPDNGMFQSPIYQYWAGSYRGSDGDSGFAYPEVVTGSSASNVGGPTFRIDQSGFSAAEYDGSNDGHDALTGALPTGAVQVSFAALVYVPSSHTGRVFAYGSGNNGESILLGVRNDNTVEATVLGSSYSFATGGTYPTGEWMTIGASFDTDTADAVLNGAFVATNSGNNYNISNQTAGIGYSGFESSFWFNGYVAEVIVSNASEPEQAFNDYHNDRLGN